MACASTSAIVQEAIPLQTSPSKRLLPSTTGRGRKILVRFLSTAKPESARAHCASPFGQGNSERTSGIGAFALAQRSTLSCMRWS